MQHFENSGLLLSVIICTYNRAELLTTALQTLSEQTIDTSHFEVIVVDNNSKDNTRSIIKSFCRDYPNIRYCFETRQGLSHARNRGWQEAKGVYVAYIDDDCKVPAQWLAVAKQIIERQSPAVFGGPYFGYYKSSMPSWWKESYESFGYSETARTLNAGEFLRGTNIIIQRTLLEKFGGFNVELGMSGEKFAYGEESELQNRIRTTMPDVFIYYEPELYVYHLIRPEKITLRYILYSRFAGGRHIYSVFYDETPKTPRLLQLLLLVQAVFTILWFFADVFVSVFLRDREQYPYMQNYMYENTFEHVHTLGRIYERFIHCW